MKKIVHIAATLAAMAAWGFCSSAWANSCTIGATPVAFGSYDVFASSDTTSVGTVTYSCNQGAPITITMDRGGAASFTTRRMLSGTNQLNYNLFLDPQGSQIWGDGTGGSQYLTDVAPRKTPTTANVYGRIPALQDAAVGTYSNTVVATINF